MGHPEEELVAETTDGSGVSSTSSGGSKFATVSKDHSADVFSIANIITVLRLVLIPIFYWALVWGGNDTLAFVLFVVTASTDWLDGMIARRTGTVTNIGKVIDPLVDRLLIAAALIGLYVVGRVPLWLLLLLVARDVYLLYGAWVLERHGRRLDVTVLGKATTAVLLAGFAGLIWNVASIEVPVLATFEIASESLTLGGTRPVGAYIVCLGVFLSLSAAVQYTVLARRAYREAVAEERVRDGREAEAEAQRGPETEQR